jgi:predicted nucleic acid-binding protein
MPDGMGQHQRFVDLAKHHYGLLVAQSGHGIVPVSRRLTAHSEFLRTGKLIHSIRVRSHFSSRLYTVAIQLFCLGSAGTDRTGRARLVNDALTATSAARAGVTVITANARDFARLAEFQPFSWLTKGFPNS